MPVCEIQKGGILLKELRLRLKFLTPAFLGGADGKTAELRPPSLKGMLRFWWRAAHSGDPEMKIKEAEIFGHSSGKGKASVFTLQVRSNFSGRSISQNLLPSNSDTQYTVRGRKLNILEYLAYGIKKVQGGRTYGREYIKPGSEFDLILRFKTDREVFIGELCEALRNWAFFGGLGAKSRNGFGSVAVVSASGHPLLEGLTQTMAADEFKRAAGDGAEFPEFTAFSREARLFRTRETYGSWHACLAELGRAYREARLSLENKGQYPLRSFIGAPMIVNKRQVSLLERRTKPYFLRVHQEGNGLRGYILCLPSRYFIDAEEPEPFQNAGYTAKRADEEFKAAYSKMNEYLSSRLEEIR